MRTRYSDHKWTSRGLTRAARRVGTGLLIALLAVAAAGAVRAAATAGASASSIVFGLQPVGLTSGAQTFAFENNGDAPLTLQGFSLVGANPGDFAVSASGSGSIAPGGFRVVSATFTPSGAGSRSALLFINSNDPQSPLGVLLSGTGVATGGVPLQPVTAEVFVSAINSMPTSGMPGQVSVNVGDCVSLMMLVRFRSGAVLDVTNDPNTAFATDPPQFNFAGTNVFCTSPANANHAFTIYGKFFSPAGPILTGTASIKVRPLPGVSPPGIDPNSIATTAALSITEIDGSPYSAPGGQATVPVGHCATLRLMARFPTGWVDVTDSPFTLFFTDPTRGTQPFSNVFCATPADANKVFAVYGEYLSPNGQSVVGAVSIRVPRNDGKP